jgi:hypothetical protein
MSNDDLSWRRPKYADVIWQAGEAGIAAVAATAGGRQCHEQLLEAGDATVEVLLPTWERHQEERGEVQFQWIFGYPALSIQTNPMRLDLMERMSRPNQHPSN